MKEVRAIEAMGVAIVLNHKVDDLLGEMQAGRFDAAFLAIGAHLGKRIDIPARDASRMVTAVSLLRDAATGAAPKLGRRVVVYGAGNTAMDAARTAKRLGAEEAIIVYRSDRAHMKAQAFEVQEAIEEGVKIRWLTSIKSLEGTNSPSRRWSSPRSAEANRPPRDALRGRGGARGRPGDRQRIPPDPGHRIPVRRRGGRRAQHDDGPSRDLRRRRHGADRADGDRGRRPRQEGGPPHRRLAAGSGRRLPAPAGHPIAAFDQLNDLVLLGRAPHRCQPQLEARAPAFDLRRGRRWTVDTSSKHAAALLLRQLFFLRQLLQRLSRRRGSSSSAAERLGGAPRLLQGYDLCVTRAPAAPIEIVPEEI